MLSLTSHILALVSSFAESKRTDFKLDLLKLRSGKMEKVGQWTPLDALNVTDPYAFTHGNYS